MRNRLSSSSMLHAQTSPACMTDGRSRQAEYCTGSMISRRPDVTDMQVSVLGKHTVRGTLQSVVHFRVLFR